MACICENPHEIRKLVQGVESDAELVQLVSDKCVGYHLVDGFEEFALLGLSDKEKERLSGSGWVQIENSYLWIKHVEEKIQE